MATLYLIHNIIYLFRSSFGGPGAGAAVVLELEGLAAGGSRLLFEAQEAGEVHGQQVFVLFQLRRQAALPTALVLSFNFVKGKESSGTATPPEVHISGPRWQKL